MVSSSCFPVQEVHIVNSLKMNKSVEGRVQHRIEFHNPAAFRGLFDDGITNKEYQIAVDSTVHSLSSFLTKISHFL